MIPSQILYWNPRPQYDGIWRWGILGVIISWGPSLHAWDPLYRGPRELSAHFSIGGHGEKTVGYESGNGPSPDTESACPFDLGLPSLRTVRNTFLFRPFCLWYFCCNSLLCSLSCCVSLPLPVLCLSLLASSRAHPPAFSVSNSCGCCWPTPCACCELPNGSLLLQTSFSDSDDGIPESLENKLSSIKYFRYFSKVLMLCPRPAILLSALCLWKHCGYQRLLCKNRHMASRKQRQTVARVSGMCVPLDRESCRWQLWDSHIRAQLKWLGSSALHDLSSVQFSCSVVSSSLWPHGWQHARLPCPSPTPRACSNSCLSNQWCHPTIPSSVHPLLLLTSVFPSIRISSNESVIHIRWPKYWSFSFSISSSNEYSELISFRMDWFNTPAVQGTLKSLLQHHSSKASTLRCSAFFIVQLSHSYVTTGKP